MGVQSLLLFQVLQVQENQRCLNVLEIPLCSLFYKKI